MQIKLSINKPKFNQFFCKRTITNIIIYKLKNMKIKLYKNKII